jgi:hypothetical protein
MSDPVLVANVIGLQTALDAKAASSHTHAIADTTGLQTALDAKQATLVSGTNIKTVHGTSLLGSGNIEISSGSLTTVTITDAAVAMTANRRYQGSIAAFTADRNYTLPAGTAGDVIEVQITTGDDLYELILLGASGVSINGGSAATEWTRLFISNELVRFYCFATNDWRVVVDGRLNCRGSRYLSVAKTLANATWVTSVDYATVNANVGDIATPTGKFTIRRAGVHRISISGSLSSSSVETASLGSGSFYFQITCTKNGTVITGTGVATGRSFSGSGILNSTYPLANQSVETSLSAGDVLEVNLYQKTESTAYVVNTAADFWNITEVLR